MNLQGVIVEPVKRQTFAGRPTQDRLVQISRSSHFIDIKIIGNVALRTSCGRLDQNRDQLLIRRRLPPQFVMLCGTSAREPGGEENQKTK